MPYNPSRKKLRELMARRGKVLTVMHPPSVTHARIMEAAGCEAGFIGTSVVVGMYTGMEDTGIASGPECVQIGGWIARGVDFPVILDGDTGHGGVMAVRRIVQDCIHAGLAGIRIDDQSIEDKRGTGTAGIVVAPDDIAIARYKAAVDARNELDPDFVIQAQCYVGEAANGGHEEALRRMKLYEEEGGVDWVQYTAPRDMQQAKEARDVVKGAFSIMGSYIKPTPTHQQLMDAGIFIEWAGVPVLPATYIALYDLVKDSVDREPTVAAAAFREKYKDHPVITGEVKVMGKEVALQAELEKKYFSAEALQKYELSKGNPNR
ncbi:MAG: isocitrate lyase/phosphoenolpyruvate mutase family protein [Dehalococcoidia bacterium]